MVVGLKLELVAESMVGVVVDRQFLSTMVVGCNCGVWGLQFVGLGFGCG